MRNNLTYFVEYISKEIKKLIGNKNLTTNIYIIQAFDSIMRGYFCIGFIDFMFKVKKSNLFSPNYQFILP